MDYDYGSGSGVGVVGTLLYIVVIVFYILHMADF
jgi:hypothetical protein